MEQVSTNHKEPINTNYINLIVYLQVIKGIKL